MLNFQIFIYIALFVLVNKLCEAEIAYDSFHQLSELPPQAFGKPNLKSGEILSKWNPKDGGNPEEQGTYFQGDILFPKSNSKYGYRDVTKRWSNGIVPYVISGQFNLIELNLIRQAINEFDFNTCIRFIPRTNQIDYVSITRDNTGCFSAIGRIGGRQQLNLQSPGCTTYVGTTIHELMHTIGFFHEHTRYDRDDYVTVHIENVTPGTEYNFNKVSNILATTYNLPYDYESLMHYSIRAGSVNGLATIVPKRPAPNMGQRIGFSENDIREINIMYNCPQVSSTTKSWFHVWLYSTFVAPHSTIAD